jgi:hypothetical protein
MKSFAYKWHEKFDGIYLLHAQVDLEDGAESFITKTRIFKDGKKEIERMPLLEQSHRFIISRTHPDEVEMAVDYPDDSKLTIYEIDDRAYYPTEYYFEG